MARPLLRRLAALALGLLAATAAAEVGGRWLRSGPALAGDASPAQYYAALGAHESDHLAPRVEAPAKRGFRIVVVGDSTAVGYPYRPELSFGAMLADGLTAATGRTCEFFVVGMPGRSSLGVLANLDAALNLQPDLLLVYVGHNEIAYRLVREPPFGPQRHGLFANLLPGITDLLGDLRWHVEGRQANDLAGIPQIGREPLAKAAALLAHGNTESRPPRELPVTPREIELLYARYRDDIAQIGARADGAGVPIVFIEPVANLLARPLSSGRAFDPRAQRAWDEGQRLLAEDPLAARKQFELARDADPAPVRLRSDGLAQLRDGAGGRPLLSLAQPDRPLEDRFVDLVHPRPALAAAFAEAIALALPALPVRTQVPAQIPSLSGLDTAARERFRAACTGRIAARTGEIAAGEQLATLQLTYMYLQYGNPAGAEAIATRLPPDRRDLSLCLLLDLARRWRGQTAAAEAALDEAAVLHPDWQPAIEWWRARAHTATGS